MSALAHGWKPDEGSVAKIPVKVAKDFHAADAGHKYGKGMHKGDKTKKALRTARKYSKKAEGGKIKKNPFIHSTEGLRHSPNVEDRRGEWMDKFHDTNYFPPEPGPSFSPGEAIGQLPDALGAASLDQQLAGFADGGEVDDDKQQAIDIHPVDPNEGLTADLMKRTPLEGAEPASPALTAHRDTPREKITNWLAGPDTPSYAPRAVLANKAMNVLDFTPPMMAEKAGEDVAKGNYQDAAMFAVPGLKKAKGTAKAAMDWGEAMEIAATQPFSSNYEGAGAVFKALKEPFPKNVAEMAAYKGYTPDEVDNIKSHLLPGAQKAFDKHYGKIAPSEQPHIGPEDIDPGYQGALTPDHPNYIQDYHTSQGVDYDKVLANIEKAIDDFEPRVPKPKGKDTDIEDYYAQMEKQQEGPEWQPPADDSTEPQNVLPPALSPQDLEEKSAKLGLNTTAFHGTKSNFSEFKNPEELPSKSAQIGVHFGTLRAAIDRATPYNHPLERSVIEDNIKANANVTRDPIALRPSGTQFRVIPARIGANNPLVLRDLGTWYPDNIKSGLLAHPSVFTQDEINRAMTVPGKEPPPYTSHDPRDIQRIKNLRQLIESKGYDSIAYKNGVEDAGSTSYIIWNLNKARSFYAKFDPAKAHSKDLAAGIGGLSLLPLGLYEGSSEPEQRHFAHGGRVEAEKALPANHQLGMKVPKGGSMCANCKFLASPTTCGNKGFIEWNGKPELPAPADQYCCDLYGHDKPKRKAEGGAVGDDYNTVLSPEDEAKFQVWKQQNMPNDSGVDYDQRGAYLAQFQQQPNGHWQDQFKKPNHPTFSDQSQYAVGDQRDRAGSWNDDQFIPPANKKGGGKVANKEEDPKDHQFTHFANGGLINSDIPGRTDKIPLKVPPGSYVLPADIPSALGQGNTKAGSEVLSKMFTHAPYGLKPMTQKGSRFSFPSFPTIGHSIGKADGGRTDHVPIIAAGGEYIIHPDVVKEVGHGDIKKGHDVLDKFVLHTRAEHIKTLKKLKGPKQ